MATTNYNEWLMHLHVGRRREPLTVYPTDVEGVVTVMWRKQIWECVPTREAEQVVGRAVLMNKGNVTL